MKKDIILISYLFGTIYIFSKSIDLYMKIHFENKNENIPIDIVGLNMIVLTLTGILFTINCHMGLSYMEKILTNK